MGIYYCDVCNELLDGETFSCITCGRGGGDGVIYCEDCIMTARCDACNERCCKACGDKRFKCCGKVLCGAGRDEKAYPDAESLQSAFGVCRDACVWRHTVSDTPWPGCTHVRCSEQPVERGFVICAAASKAEREAERVVADRGARRRLSTMTSPARRCAPCCAAGVLIRTSWRATQRSSSRKSGTAAGEALVRRVSEWASRLRGAATWAEPGAPASSRWHLLADPQTLWLALRAQSVLLL